MQNYLRFLGIGLILGLFTEFELKLVAGIRPATFLAALFFYPILVSLAYAGSRLLDGCLRSQRTADILHFLLSGIFGLAVEWVLLGNGPGSKAFQLGMFAMWTTFCFGPRVLSRVAFRASRSVRWFWIFFAVVGVLITITVLLIPSPNARVVLVVLGLSAEYLVLSIWLLVIAMRSATAAPSPGNTSVATKLPADSEGMV